MTTSSQDVISDISPLLRAYIGTKKAASHYYLKQWLSSSRIYIWFTSHHRLRQLSARLMTMPGDLIKGQGLHRSEESKWIKVLLKKTSIMYVPHWKQNHWRKNHKHENELIWSDKSKQIIYQYYMITCQCLRFVNAWCFTLQTIRVNTIQIIVRFTVKQ